MKYEPFLSVLDRDEAEKRFRDALGFGFLPLCEGQFDPVVGKSRLHRHSIRALLEELVNAATKAALRARGLRA